MTYEPMSVWTWHDGTGHFAPTAHRERQVDDPALNVIYVSEAYPTGPTLCGQTVPDGARIGTTGRAYTVVQEMWEAVERICEDCIAQVT